MCTLGAWDYLGFSPGDAGEGSDGGGGTGSGSAGGSSPGSPSSSDSTFEEPGPWKDGAAGSAVGAVGMGSSTQPFFWARARACVAANVRGWPVISRRSVICAAVLSVPGAAGVRSLQWNAQVFDAYGKSPGAGKYFDFEAGNLIVTGSPS